MTEQLPENDANLDALLNRHFAGKVVRKDLTKLIKEGANVPVYVLEYLLGMYCASDDQATIDSGLVNVKRILSRELRSARRSREGQVEDPRERQLQGHRQGDGQAQRKARCL
jgi:predicted ATP-dependent Lon-type protease